MILVTERCSGVHTVHLGEFRQSSSPPKIHAGLQVTTSPQSPVLLVPLPHHLAVRTNAPHVVGAA